MKRKLFICLILIFVNLFLIAGCSKREDGNSSTPAKQPSSGASADSENVDNKNGSTENSNTENQQVQNKEIIVQRESDCYSFENAEINNEGIVQDIENLLWIVPRGGAGIDEPGIDKDISELPVINEINNVINSNYTTNEKNNKYTWIRLVYDPYTPKEGENAANHKDIILYVDPDNTSNVIFGIQNPEKESQWNITALPGYGEWLRKEIDILLRIKTGL